MSCTGAQFCPVAVIETKNRAMAVVSKLEEELEIPKAVRIHWTGCPNSCGQVGTANGLHCLVGATGCFARPSCQITNLRLGAPRPASPLHSAHGVRLLEILPGTSLVCAPAELRNAPT